MAVQREWFEKDYYKILGVSSDADAKEITRAYRKLARKYHPDANPGDTAAEERFKEISGAYDVIGDPEKRKEYDEARAMGPIGAMGGFGGGTGGPGGPGGAGGFTFDASQFSGGGGGLGDILGNLFGGGGRAGRATGPVRGADLEAEVHLDFVDAVRGVETTLHLVSDAVCDTCAGSGAEPGTLPKTCPTCSGTGAVQDDQGFFATSRPCPTCAGRGAVIENPCHTCHGSGVERRPRDVKVRIPAGVSDGRKLRIGRRGNPGRNGGPPGDLLVNLRVAEDRLFELDGRDLRITVPVTFAEAALGADIDVPLVDGGTAKLRMPAGTPNGRTFRVRGKGARRKDGTFGDLLATVEVQVPAVLDGAARKAVEDYRDATADKPMRGGLFEDGA